MFGKGKRNGSELFYEVDGAGEDGKDYRLPNNPYRIFPDLDGDEDKNEIKFTKRKIFPYFNFKQGRKCVGIVGPNRCGKTFCAAKIMDQYSRYCPLNKIFLFKPDINDPVIDDVIEKIDIREIRRLAIEEMKNKETPEQIMLEETRKNLIKLFSTLNWKPNEEGLPISFEDLQKDDSDEEEEDVFESPVIENTFEDLYNNIVTPIESTSIGGEGWDCFLKENLKDSLVVFDDFEANNARISRSFYNIIDKILTIGRKLNISMIVILHNITAGAKTKLINSECEYFFHFPKYSSPTLVKYHMINHLGVSPEMVEYLRKKKGRWCCIHRDVPSYIMTHDKCFNLLSDKGKARK